MDSEMGGREVTQLLDAWSGGDRQALERPGHTLQPTALVNEAFLRPPAGRCGAALLLRRPHLRRDRLALKVSPVTVKRDLKAARMWLLQELQRRGGEP